MIVCHNQTAFTKTDSSSPASDARFAAGIPRGMCICRALIWTGFAKAQGLALKSLFPNIAAGQITTKEKLFWRCWKRKTTTVSYGKTAARFMNTVLLNAAPTLSGLGL